MSPLTERRRVTVTIEASDVFIKSSAIEWEEVGEGITRQIMGYDEGLMLVRVRFEKEAVGALHSHPHRQVTYVESGRFEVEVGQEKEVLVSGDGFYIPPDVEHGVLALEGGVLIDVFAPAREDFLQAP